MNNLIRIALPLCLFLLLSFSITPSANALQDTLPPAGWEKAGPQAHAEAVFNAMVQGDTKNAFKTLFSTGRYSKDKLEKLQFEFFRVVKKQGKPYAYEKILEHRAGTAIIHLRYVLLFRSMPMMFDLYYYSVEKGWLLKTYTISTDIKKVFER
ncbi:hypothetical protein [uncultured Pseudodesulfovibrio sp.]|uniref:hypothetical protein n=1 Tax=uncultured Pseudodesulfovibrio sp. TaxID=2035858 RepID=UPI0029C6649F|nr:hypothetical protein [uncultured Pseudodesulfovibrio sp.]